MSITETKFIDLLEQYKVIIPPIQRDYAQGRNNEEVRRIRHRFLNNISDVLAEDYNDAPLKLDFIYGYLVKDEGEENKKDSIPIFKPLDGQQRLTTLFLLHWYTAVTENKITDENQALLANFSYATRDKCRKFCEKLIHFIPNQEVDSKPIKLQIENQPWFFISWQSDPTIASMLVMLDAIETVFNTNNLKNVWEKLTGDSPKIVFYLLEMKGLGLPEDLYIKMNSRGKSLTNFEHFKSQFSGIIPDSMVPIFNQKIDNQWSNLFWDIHKANESTNIDIAAEVDQSFLNFYQYITDLLITTKNITIEDDYWQEVANTVYRNNERNVNYLFDALDTFVNQQKNNPHYFFEYLYVSKTDFSVSKVRLFFNSAETNLFYKCAQVYNIEQRNAFSIGEQLMLYAMMRHLQEDIVGFSDKIRKIRNLIIASDDNIRKEYLKVLYKDIDNILNDKNLEDDSQFSKQQLSEESIKSNIISNNQTLKSPIYKLEDHNLLRGSVSIMGLTEDNDITSYATMFDTIFSRDTDESYKMISRAMMSIDDYSQDYSYGKRRIGNNNASIWRELFTKSDRRKGFDNTREILQQYLKIFLDNPDTSNQSIINNYSQESYPWNYYFAKYSSFSNFKSGYYFWGQYKFKPYECFMMNRKQFNGHHWNPFLLELRNQHKNYCSIDDYGNDLQFAYENCILNIRMYNNNFEFYAPEEDSVSNIAISRIIEHGILDKNASIVVPQDTEGYDLNDRIRLCSNTLLDIERFLIDL
tara:strand:- start:2640 stop:4898 length:2259 start_codon:yes stop_codon:yes gene_type:complete